jgi:hypothetical protein
MSDALLFSGGILIVIVGLKLLNDKGGVFGIAVLIGGFVALARACGCEWINR